MNESLKMKPVIISAFGGACLGVVILGLALYFMGVSDWRAAAESARSQAAECHGELKALKGEK